MRHIILFASSIHWIAFVLMGSVAQKLPSLVLPSIKPLNQATFSLLINVASNFPLASSLSRTLKDVSLNSNNLVRNTKYWLDTYGSPRRLPPAVWCTNIPSSSSSPLEDIDRAPHMYVVVPIHSVPLKVKEKAGALENECSGSFVLDVFNSTKFGKIPAWVSSFAYAGRYSSPFCEEGLRVDTALYAYFTHVFRPPGPNNNIVVTCSCEKKSGECIPTAQWEVNTNAKVTYSEERETKEEILQAQDEANVAKQRFTQKQWKTEPPYAQIDQEINGRNVWISRRLKDSEKTQRFRRGGDPKEKLFERRIGGGEISERRFDERLRQRNGRKDTKILPPEALQNPSNKKDISQADSPIKQEASSNPLWGSKEIEDVFATAVAGGYALTTSAIVGEESDIAISSQDSRLIFESHVYGTSSYPWPDSCWAQCSAMANTPDCLQPLILFGCPVSPKLDFMVHRLSTDTEKNSSLPSQEEEESKEASSKPKPGKIVFSFVPFAFEKDVQEKRHVEPITIRCKMSLHSEPPIREQFCGNRPHATDLSTESSQDDKNASERYDSPKRAARHDKNDSHDLNYFNGTQHKDHQSMGDYVKEVSSFVRYPMEVIRNRRLGFIKPVTSITGFTSFDGSNAIEKHFEVVENERKKKGGKRYVPKSNRLLESIRNEIIYDKWGVDWAKSYADRATYVKVGNDKVSVVVGVELSSKSGSADVKWGDSKLSVSANKEDRIVAVGFIKGKYGVNVSQSSEFNLRHIGSSDMVARGQLDNSAVVEVVARNSEFATIADINDRDFGQRVKIGDFEINVKHDFDEFIKPQPDEMATEIGILYKSIGVKVATDVPDSKYGVSVSRRGFTISAERDFDDRITRLQGNWGNGWQLVLEGDLMDEKSSELYGLVGFGKKGTAYVAVGAGIGNNGIRKGSAEIETGDFGLDVSVVKGDSIDYSMTIGKFTYTWESRIIPDNAKIPLLFRNG